MGPSPAQEANPEAPVGLAPPGPLLHPFHTWGPLLAPRIPRLGQPPARVFQYTGDYPLQKLPYPQDGLGQGLGILDTEWPVHTPLEAGLSLSNFVLWPNLLRHSPGDRASVWSSELTGTVLLHRVDTAAASAGLPWGLFPNFFLS